MFRAVLGLSWGPCWPYFWSLRPALKASSAILGLAKAGQARSGQVRSGQSRSRSIWGPPGLWSEARSGQEGVPRSYKDGSALENPSCSQESWRGSAPPDPALENPSSSKRILRASWVHVWRSYSVLGAFWGGLGPSWAFLGQPRDVFKTSWGRLGGVLGAKAQTEEGDIFVEPIFGSILEGSWPVLGALGPVLGGIFASLGASAACLEKTHVKHSIFDVLEMVFQ